VVFLVFVAMIFGSFSIRYTPPPKDFLIELILSEKSQLIKDEQENIQHINWRADGKISSIIRTTGGSQSSLLFTYNPMGQSLSKELYDENDAWVETTYYIRDALVRNLKDVDISGLNRR